MRNLPITSTPHSHAASVSVRNVGAAVAGRTVVHGVTFDVTPGKRVAIVGPNGSGKTTLMRCLAGLTAPTAGEVAVNDRDIARMGGRERAQRIAFVAQDQQLSGELTLAEMVGQGRTPHRSAWSFGGRDDERIVTAALDAVGLADRAHASCGDLSGGEQRRAIIARGLAQQCPLLFLDEPTNHLDVAWQLDVIALMQAAEATVIASMHNLDLVLRYFDTVAVLAAGGLRAYGPPAEVLSDEVTSDVFGVHAVHARHPVDGSTRLLLGPRCAPRTQVVPSVSTDATPSPGSLSTQPPATQTLPTTPDSSATERAHS